MSKMFMGSTKVGSHQTIAQVQSLLVRAGASQISQDYSERGTVTGFRFQIAVGEQLLCYSLPVRITRVFQRLQNGVEANRNARDPEANLNQKRSGMAAQHHVDAERIAWRQILRWLEAQLALIDIGLSSTQEVFTPYMVMPGSGLTLFEHLEATHFKALPAGKKL